MKIKNVIVAALSLVALVSCGESGPTICSCTELSVEMFKEVGIDQDKMKAFEENHKEEMDKCEALGDKINKEMKDLSQEEQEKMQKEYMDDCPAMEELENLVKEAYQNFDPSQGMEEALEGIEGLEGMEEGVNEMLEGLEENGGELLENIQEAVEDAK